MCFANSVLQVLVYCVPFRRLFGELGRIVGPPGVVLGPGGGEGEGDGDGEGGTLLVEATVRFLKEFDVEVQDAKGSGGGDLRRRGKGKEADRRGPGSVDRVNGDEWNGNVDAFIPSYVYDAMKGKKHFENINMRVRHSYI
jgi:ubiquitin carboxyl-terminal hydrolase 10